MNKNRYDRVINLLFAAVAALTFFSLYQDIIWLSGVLAAVLCAIVALHIRDYIKERPRVKKIFVLSLVIYLNFLLANVIIVLARFVYPY